MNLDEAAQIPFQAASIVSTQTGLPVAQYVRMSKEHQCYSTQNQMHAIAVYAEAHGMVVVRSFSDEGRSGLTLDHRPGLLSLLSAVQTGSADFKAILVYDVSRWGRFQDTDESGYWEHICKRAGIRVHYCTEPFANDGSLISAIIKSIKRSMAAEYSRELSVKTFAGQCRLVKLGYRQGGPGGYGFRRMLIDQQHHFKGILPLGARKSLQTDRVVLVPGPETEQRIVQEIYRSFVEEGQSISTIANALNARGIAAGTDHPWTSGRILEILRNPKYAGHNVFNRVSRKLNQPRVENPESLWIRHDGAFAPIVSTELFDRAKTLLEIRKRSLHQEYSPQQMLDGLRALLLQMGKLSIPLINQAPGMPKAHAISRQFGGMRQAYEKVGYCPRYVVKVETDTVRRRCLNEFLSGLEAVGAIAATDSRTGVIHVNENLRVRFCIAQCFCKGPEHRWWIPRKTSPTIDLTIIARLNFSNDAVWDFYIFPNECFPMPTFLGPRNSSLLEIYRFDNLDRVCDVFRRHRVGDDHDTKNTK